MKKVLRWYSLAALLSGAAFFLPPCEDETGTGPAPYDGPWKAVFCPEGLSFLKGVFFLNSDLGYAVGSNYDMCSCSLKYEGEKWEVDYSYPAAR